MNFYKKFISPIDLMKRFNLDKNEYRHLLELGLPVYGCAGIQRHAIDEVYLWCEANKIPIQDNSELYSGKELIKIFGITEKTLSSWIEMGLPKQIIPNKSNPYKRHFAYNVNDVRNWLRTQYCLQEV